MALESKVIFVDETNITFAFQNSQILVSHFISMDENSYNNIFAQSDARSIETRCEEYRDTRSIETSIFTLPLCTTGSHLFFCK